MNPFTESSEIGLGWTALLIDKRQALFLSSDFGWCIVTRFRKKVAAAPPITFTFLGNF